ncbi:MAG: 1-(5-phosphoribosyl)-5-[(5-phosphoribosylamino)methylideneamino]imidazole-4-carboxamide isomerase [Bacillota bacterium]
MLIIPAIDLRDGHCVRLVQGRLEEQTVFSLHPEEIAVKWETAGAKMIHVVDLDGAFAGEPRNLEAISAIIAAVSIPIQLGGGIRTLDTIEKMLQLGVSRVILGTAAISRPQLISEAVARYGQKVLVGIDSKDGRVAVEGWASVSEKTALELAMEIKEAGIQRVVYTDTRRDGTLQGPNLDSTRELARITGLRVIASGGVSSLGDLRALKKCEPDGVDGVILGKALYTGAFTLPEALAIAEEGCPC